MQLSGVGLEGEAKEQFNSNQMKLAELSTAFSNNLLDATKAYSMLITEPAQVSGAAGVGPWYLSALHPVRFAPWPLCTLAPLGREESKDQKPTSPDL